MCRSTTLRDDVVDFQEDGEQQPGEVFVPAFDDDTKRRSPVGVAVFNLVATVVGGGILSMPLAFEKCGVIPATLLMVVSAVATDRSLYLLCLCSRYTGASSFGEVGRKAFGSSMEWFVSLLLFVFLVFVLVAFMVLARDIWTSALNMVFFSTTTDDDDNNNDDTTVAFAAAAANGDVVLLVVVAMMSPFLLSRTLYTLRYNCYVGFASISFLCVAMCHRLLWQAGGGGGGTTSTTNNNNEIKLVASSLDDALYGFPIIMLGFLCSYNILQVHSSMIRPTKARVGYVVNGAMASSFVVTYVFGLVGYLLFGSSVRGNVLNNFDRHHHQQQPNGGDDTDWALLFGKLAYGITITLGMAVVTLPCRESILEVLDRFFRSPSQADIMAEEEEDQLPVAAAFADERTYLLLLQRQEVEDDDEERKNNQLQQKQQQEEEVVTTTVVSTSSPTTLGDNPLIHFGSTFFIVSVCYIGAVAAPGVDIVWSLCGSCMAFLLSFILPAVFFLKIYHDMRFEKSKTTKQQGNIQNNEEVYVAFSWGLLLFAVAGAIACTIQSVWRLL